VSVLIPGCDVRITWNGRPAYLRVEALLVATVRGQQYLFVVPIWYTIDPGLHPILHTTCCRKEIIDREAQFQVVPASDCVEQVMVLHDCGGGCTVVCADHGGGECGDGCLLLQHVEHDETNRQMIIFQREDGFRVPTRRLT
jgi:hypothetical protein